MKKIKNLFITFLCVLSLGLTTAFVGCDSLLGGIKPPVESSSSQDDSSRYDCIVGNHLKPIDLGNGQYRCDNCGATWGEGGSETGGCESGKHQMITYNAVPSTCVKQGWSMYEACELCGFGEENKKALDLDPNNHENQTRLDNGQFYCSDCSTTWGDPEGHTHVWDEGVEEVPATCGQEGVKRISCGCGESYTEAIPATGMHVTEVLYGKEATCQETGLTEGSWCPVCETVFEEQKEIPTAPHTEEIVYGHEAGCETEGLSDGVWCSTCQTILKSQETLSPLGHQEVEMSPAIKGDCHKEGYTAEIWCSRCQTTIQYATPTGFGDHVMTTYPGQPADCWNEGWEDYEACELCGYGKENMIIIPRQHEWEKHERIEPTCSQEGWEAYVSCRNCDEGEWNRISLGFNPENHVNITETDGYTYCNDCGASWGDGSGGEIGGGEETGGCESGNHSFDWVPYQDATCYEQGWNSYEKCINCGYVNGEIPYIEAGHQIEYMGAKDPTCHEIGWYEYQRCMRCEYTTYQERPKLEHQEVFEKGYEPTCNKPGSTGYVYCELCGDTLKEEEEIPMIAHTPVVKEAGRAPTCDAWGWTDEIWCSMCRKVLEEMVDIEPLPHTPVYVPEQPASCTKKGTTAYEYCEVCENVIGEEPEETDYALHNFPAWGEVCLDCGTAYYSQGLEYFEEWHVDKIGEYYVWGLGTCMDTDLVIPDELHGVPVTEITLYSGDFGEVGAENITSLSFGSNITLVTGNSFETCTSLTNVYYRGTLGGWASTHVGSLLYDTETRVLHIDGKPVEGDIMIPDDVTSIGTGAFAYQPITSVTMGDQVESLGMMAFYNCKDLKSARLSANIKTIDWSAFEDCTSLIKVEMDGVETLDNDAFSNCQSLLSVYLPSVKKIGMRAFENCYSLEEVVCGEFLTTIGSSAFQDCTALNSITLPDALTKIDTYAFNGCESLEGFVVGLNVTFIGSRAFANCTNLKEVIFQVTEGWTYTRNNTIYDIIGLDDAEKAATQFAGIAGGYNWTRA